MKTTIHSVLTIGLLVVLIGCASESEQKAANGIAERFGARSCSMTYGVEAGRGRYIELNLSEVPGFKEYRSMEFVTSIAALRYYDGMSAEQKAKYDEIRVNVTGDGITFEKAYLAKDIPDVQATEVVVVRYMSNLLKRNHAELNQDLDRELIPDSSLAQVQTAYNYIDSVQGYFSSYGIVGYEPVVARNGIGVIQMWVDAPTADSSLYNFTFVMNRENRKLVHVAFE